MTLAASAQAAKVMTERMKRDPAVRIHLIMPRRTRA
jgi:hypothetical protein